MMFWKKAEQPRPGVLIVNKAPDLPRRPTKSLFQQIAAQQPTKRSHCCCCCKKKEN